MNFLNKENKKSLISFLAVILLEMILVNLAESRVKEYFLNDNSELHFRLLNLHLNKYCIHSFI